MDVSGEINTEFNGVVTGFSSVENISKTQIPDPLNMLNLSFDSVGDDTKIEKWYFSDETVQVFSTVNLAVVCVGLCVFGIIANIMNITVFTKQGFHETINITLFALAVSDLASLVALLWMGICANPFFKYADTPLVLDDVMNITGGWIHVLFTAITGWLTAVVTVERCLCVIFPLKIRIILTPIRIKIIIVAIFLVVAAGMAPIFYSNNLGWKFVPERNRTMVGMVYTDNWDQLMEVASPLSGVVSALSNSIVVMTSTGVLVVNLNAKTKWRQQTVTNLDKRGQMAASRDQRVIKMVVIIATIFIVCLLPSSMITIPMAIDPEFSLKGKYYNVIMVTVTFVMVLAAINSGGNIFVYYTMSSKYRSVFRSIFCKGKKK